MAQNNVQFHASKRPAPKDAQPVGAPDPNSKLEITIVVRRRAAIPDEGTTEGLSRNEFSSQYGANPADLKKVEDYATAQGFTVESADAARRSVVVSGPLGKLAEAFGADLRLYEQNGEQFRARSGTLTVPKDLQEIIQGIFGFDERPQAQPRLRFLSEQRGAEIRPRLSGNVSYSPLELALLYQFPSGTGAGQTIGIIELGGGYHAAELKRYFADLGVHPAPKVVSVAVDKGKNHPSGDPNSADGEVLLDIEVAGAIAPGATIAVYFAPNTTRGFLDAITTAIHDTKHHPSVISISWGGAESSYAVQAFDSYDQAFQDAAALGVTVCAASGDDGSEDREADGEQHVDFPASSPFVLACGGTSLQAANGQIHSETVWNNGAGNGASGGGVSEHFPRPDYQRSAQVPVSVNSSGFAGRGVPDVSGDADPATGYNVLVDGTPIVVGGTSAVAPLWAALIAIINQQTGKPAGFLHPTLYQNGKQAFRDITSGNNGAYAAQSGWDACTGLGSPIGTAVLEVLQGAGTATPSRTTPPRDAPDPSSTDPIT